MSRISAVILDVDGTLLESNVAHAQAFIEAARELGISTPPLEDVRRLIGMGGDKLIPRAFGFPADGDQGRRLDERKGEIFRNRFGPELQPTPGARDLLIRLRDDGFQLVVATSANGEDLELLLERSGIQDLVEHCTTSSDVDASKPEPDIVRAALGQIGTGAAGSVMIGDTPYDVEASSRAGVPIVAVRCGGWDTRALTGALAIYDDPAHILRDYDSSIFG